MFSDAVINFFINSKEAERSLDKLTKKFENAGDSMANSLLSKLGAITAGALGIKGLTEVYNEMKQIIHLAELWNMPIEKLHQFVNMFQLFGGTVDDAVSSVDRLQNLQKALINESSGELKELYARLGVNLVGQDYLGAIELIRSRFNALTDYGQKMVLDALGGDENNALIRMLRAGPNEFMGQWNEAGSFTLLTEQTKRDFIEIEQNIGKIQVALNSIGLEMLQGLAPAIKGFSDSLADFARDTETRDKIADIVKLFAAYKASVLSLRIAIGLLLRPFALLGIAAGLVYINWDKLQKPFNDFLAKNPELNKAFDDLAELAKAFADALASGDWQTFFDRIDKTIKKYETLKDLLDIIAKSGKFILSGFGLAEPDDNDVLTYDKAMGRLSDRIDALGDWILEKTGLKTYIKPGAEWFGEGIRGASPMDTGRPYLPYFSEPNQNTAYYDNRTYTFNNPSERQIELATQRESVLYQNTRGNRSGAFNYRSGSVS